jgi:ABC-type uncharacterized transport system involved in gliding motility auxiliary subunit
VRNRLHSTGANAALRAVIVVVILVVASVLFVNFFSRVGPDEGSVQTERAPRTVGFLTGHGEREIGTQYRSVVAALEADYEVREVNLADTPSVLAEVTTLVVAGAPDVPDAELFEIDQFLMKGGRALFLLDGGVIEPGTMRGRTVVVNVFDFLRSYGVTVNRDFVLDEVSADVPFRRGDETGTKPYPCWPKAVPPNLSREHPVVASLEAVVFTWTSSIAVADRLPPGVEATVLAGSSGRSWTVPVTSDLDPRGSFVPPDEQADAVRAGSGPSRPLAVAVTGALTSAFAGMPVIVEDDEGNVRFTHPPDAIDKGIGTRFVVIGNARMFEDVLLAENQSNLVLFVNAIDWLSWATE